MRKPKGHNITDAIIKQIMATNPRDVLVYRKTLYLAEINHCRKVFSRLVIADSPEEAKDKIYKEYGIEDGPLGNFSVTISGIIG